MYIFEKFVLQLVLVVAPVVFQYNRKMALYLIGVIIITSILTNIIRYIMVQKRLYLKMKCKEDLDVKMYNIIGKYYEAPIVAKAYKDETYRHLEDDNTTRIFVKRYKYITVQYMIAFVMSLVIAYYTVCYAKEQRIDIGAMVIGILIVLMQTDCTRRITECTRAITRRTLATLRAIKSEHQILIKRYKLYERDGNIYALSEGDIYFAMSSEVYSGACRKSSPIHNKGESNGRKQK